MRRRGVSRAVLEARDVTKRYERSGPLALDGVSLRVAPGEVYCLLGANGAGKTTLINLFLGFQRPTGGETLVAGWNPVSDPLEAKKHVSYVSENVRLYDNFTARQNLAYFTRLAGRRGVSRTDLYSALEKAGLQPECFERNVGAFSKGMRQKLGIAIALAKGAAAVLMDEPTSGLDPRAAREFMGLLLDLRSQGKAILMSSHDIFRVQGVADRAGILRAGKLIVEKSGRELETSDLHGLYLESTRTDESIPSEDSNGETLAKGGVR